MMRSVIVTRPATLGELAESLDQPPDRLKDLVRRHGIAPPIRVGRVGFYGPREIRRIHALAGEGDRRAASGAPRT